MWREQLTIMALAVLDDAVARASEAPTKPDNGIRLALAWLNAIGLLDMDQARLFWRVMTDHDPDRVELKRYSRTNTLSNIATYTRNQFEKGRQKSRDYIS